MLKTQLLHPEILAALARAGHGSQVLIADGNYPFATGAGPTAQRVFLNLMPGMPTVTDVLKALVTAIPIETAAVMVPPTGEEQPIHREFAAILGNAALEQHQRFDFYDLVRSSDTALVIATGEQRIYANLLLTIGVVK